MNKTIEERAKGFMTFSEKETLFFIDDVREWINQYNNKEISISKLSEVLNYKVFEKYGIAGATENQSAEAGDGWTAVEDGLPDYDEYVMWVTDAFNYFIECLDKDGNEWLNGSPDGSKPTHWRPLPAPPTVNK